MAVLELISPFTLNSNVAVVPMCTTANNCGATGASLFVSGYGQQTSDVSSSTATQLQFAPLVAIDQVACRTKWDSNFGCSNCLPATNVCAGSDPAGGNKDSCFGDSGGPLSTNTNPKRLWGVVSSGTVPADRTPSCGQANEYGVYVSLPPNLPWINSVMAGGENSTAITNACVAAGTCSSGFAPTNPSNSFFPPFRWQWYYILAIALGAGLLILLIIAICCCCNKRR